MIPKIIHYCWFGTKEKPKSVEKYINNWRKMLPDFEIMEWNEENCDLDNEVDYVKEAYRAKKYAFVSDYIRLKRLCEYGGVYLDTDVKVLKAFNDMLIDKDAVLCLQSIGNISTAFMATVKEHPLFIECLNSYKSRSFLKEDGSYDTTSINVSMDPFVEKYGIYLKSDTYQTGKNGLVMYPIEVFSAFDIVNWHPIVSANTYTVHEMASSWRPMKVRVKIVLIKLIIKLIGAKNYDRLRNLKRG